MVEVGGQLFVATDLGVQQSSATQPQSPTATGPTKALGKMLRAPGITSGALGEPVKADDVSGYPWRMPLGAPVDDDFDAFEPAAHVKKSSGVLRCAPAARLSALRVTLRARAPAG